MIYLVSKQQQLIKSTNYTSISVEHSLQLLDPLKIVGCDTETTGLIIFKDNILCIQLGCKEFQVVIDLTTINIEYYKNYLESDRLFLFWNAKFDLKFFYGLNIVFKNVYDGFLAEKLIWHGYPPHAHEMSLAAAGNYYCRVTLDKSVRNDILTKGLTDKVVVYAADDVKYLEEIYDKQYTLLEKHSLHKALKVENEFVKCLAYIEFCGAKIDPIKWKQKMDLDEEKCNSSLDKLNSWVLKNCDKKYQYLETQGDLFSGFSSEPVCIINWNSPKQVIPLFQELGINTTVTDPKTKKTKNSIDDKVLSPQSKEFEILPLFSEYKKAVKVVDTYGEKFLNLLNPVTKRIHPNFNQLGADTGRLSSTGPNLQNLPNNSITRNCFVPEDGNSWLSADYSGY